MRPYTQGLPSTSPGTHSLLIRTKKLIRLPTSSGIVSLEWERRDPRHQRTSLPRHFPSGSFPISSYSFIFIPFTRMWLKGRCLPAVLVLYIQSFYDLLRKNINILITLYLIVVFVLYSFSLGFFSALHFPTSSLSSGIVFWIELNFLFSPPSLYSAGWQASKASALGVCGNSTSPWALFSWPEEPSWTLGGGGGFSVEERESKEAKRQHSKEKKLFLEDCVKAFQNQ